MPLQGPSFDGHRFITEALAKGGAGSLVQRGQEPGNGNLSAPDKFFVLVEDALKAMGDLARFWRRQHPALKVAAITGSNGKTTTKEMAAQILSGSFRLLKNEGNLNNQIGLPLSLFRLSAEHQVAVLEMGMNMPGEIRRLKEIAEPEVSLITNIGRAHLEFLGNLEGVAQAKGELWEDLKPEDWIAVNGDDPRVVSLAAPARCQKKIFGIQEKADVRGSEIEDWEGKGIRFSLTAQGRKIPVRLPTFGRHNVYNSLGAASLAVILGISLEEIAVRLETFQPYSGRGRLIPLGKDVHLVDEAYNSNPDSLEATLTAFSEMKGKSRGWLVMGDMLEVGSDTAEVHQNAGRRMGQMGFTRLFWLGDMGEHLARGAAAAGFPFQTFYSANGPEEILDNLEGLVQVGDWILVKGSRRMKMERVVQGLIERFGQAPGPT